LSIITICNIIDKNFEKLLALDLKDILFKEKIIFFCVGSDKWTIDCFGPIIGTILKEKYKLQSLIFGELNNCLTKSNYIQYYEALRIKFPEYKIVVIDTAFCDYDNINIVRFSKGGLAVGSAFSKCDIKIGDYYITANIGIMPYTSKDRLSMPALGKVYYFAEKVSKAIAYAFY